MRIHHRLLIGALFLSLWLGGSWGYSQGTPIQLEVLSDPFIDFTSNRSSFTLNFSKFTRGVTTNTTDVTYTIKANNVVRTEGVVLAKLDDLFPNIALQAQLDSYTKNGGDAHLVATSNGFISVTTQEAGLANKVVDEGSGKILDGTFMIHYQAKALEDLAAGEHIRTLTVIFADT